MIKTIDNKIDNLGDDLKKEIIPSSKINVCASIFSMYGYKALKDELEKIDEMNFIFTDPTFVSNEKKSKEEREFEINSNNRIKSIAGSEFEIKLKNELTGKAIASECANWIEHKVNFKSNIANKKIQKLMTIENSNDSSLYLNMDEFSSAGFGYEKDNSLLSLITKFENEPERTKEYLKLFDQVWNDKENLKDVTDEVIDFIKNLYNENSPEYIYYITLYNIFSEFLEDVSEDEIAKHKTGFKNFKIWNMLYDFQEDAALGIINKLERHNGCILADSVGLGKTFTALAVIKYYELRNYKVLVLSPKKLADNWNTYISNYKDNVLSEDRFNYDVLFHTDLSRRNGMSNGLDLTKVNWGNYDLIVIDESHNFRNNSPRKDRQTRYDRLLNDIIKQGVKTKVLMLSATPVNNRFLDLKNQLALAYEGNTHLVDHKISKDKSIDTILKNAQSVFNEWNKLEPQKRTNEALLSELNKNFDFFKLLDSVTIARSRKHIEKYYDMKAIGEFPTRLRPLSLTPDLTNLDNFMTIKDIATKLSTLNMSVYSPFAQILPSKISYYEDLYDIKVGDGRTSFKQLDRESSLQILMRINLLKRLESSVHSFKLTLERILTKIENTLLAIENFESNGLNELFEDIDIDDYNTDDDIEEILDEKFVIGDKVKIRLEDMNTIGWKTDITHDYVILKELLYEINKITPEHDLKLKMLKNLIKNKVSNPINEGNKKIIVFSAFADTVNYLYKNLSLELKTKFDLDSAIITGGGKNNTTLNIDNEFNNLLMNFSPRSKNRDLLRPDMKEEIEILFATDCISEGQNLQDCDYLINYDIHWNPVKIIQRFGRIDRIGSENKVIQLVNFWPNMSLDDYINLKSRVETRMSMLDIAGTGEDNVLTNESSETSYRKEQLEKLQGEVLDIEDMNTGISIIDLGLNDFRMDLIEYVNNNGTLDHVPNGMHSVVNSDTSNNIDPGVIYILKNVNEDVNINNLNQLHPYYLIYIKNGGEILSNHLDVKSTLDILRRLTKGQPEPLKGSYEEFNKQTNDGSNMELYSSLLNKSIESIINIKEESDIDSLFTEGGTTMLTNDIKGLEDFELITFLVII